MGLSNLVQMDTGLRNAGPAKETENCRCRSCNRALDVVVSFAVVGLTLTIAGATAILGV